MCVRFEFWAFVQPGVGYDTVFLGDAALVGAIAVGMGELACAGRGPSGG
jgi:hypothetical protein